MEQERNDKHVSKTRCNSPCCWKQRMAMCFHLKMIHLTLERSNGGFIGDYHVCPLHVFCLTKTKIFVLLDMSQKINSHNF